MDDERERNAVLPPRDTHWVKQPYRRELEALNATYEDSLGADVGALRSVLDDLGRGPAVFAASGGSLVLARLAARLHERVCRAPALACTSLELLDLPQLDRRGALLFSSSAKHPDAGRVLAEFKRGRFAPSALLTHRPTGEVQALASPDTRVVSLGPPARPDGFLATGSIIQIATQLLRSYLDTPKLPPDLDAEAEDVHVRDEVLVLIPPSLVSVATDVEVRLAESGLAAVQIADFRNFAHGRHTGFARRSDRTTVFVLSDSDSFAIAEVTARALPAGTDLRRWHHEGPWESAVVRLLARSMRLVAGVGERAGIDVARPAVPAFGRHLYRLTLGQRVPEQPTGGVTRKILAAGAGDRLETRSLFAEAAAEWKVNVERERFAGLVMDYDGTVCWTQRRYDLPDAALREALTRVLEWGLIVGFASGRGRSLHADLRRWLPTGLWPQVTVGLYNGAIQLGLDEEVDEYRAPTAWSSAVVAAVDPRPGSDGLRIEERGSQVSVTIAAGCSDYAQVASLLRARLEYAGTPAMVVASGHSLDIIEASGGKTAISDTVEQRAGGPVLAIGDQGQVGGNDHALLGRTPWTLTVDRCSADPSRCWFAGSGRQTGPDLLVRYLRPLRKRKGGFAISGLEIS